MLYNMSVNNIKCISNQCIKINEWCSIHPMITSELSVNRSYEKMLIYALLSFLVSVMVSFRYVLYFFIVVVVVVSVLWERNIIYQN